MLLLGPDTARGSSATCDRGTYRAGIAKMKAKRERIAIQKRFVRNTLGSFCFFLRKLLECACVPASLFLLMTLTIAWLGKIEPACRLLQAKRFEGRSDVFEMNVERTKIIDLG